MRGAIAAEVFEEVSGAATPRFHSLPISSLKSSSPRCQPNEEQMTISLDSRSRSFQRRSGKTFRERFSTRDVTHAVAAVLVDFQAKEIADATGSSVRAAENAKQGMNAMSLAHFLNACREIPELRAMAMQMMGCETTINPDRERALAMLVNSYVRQP